ncbi:MAG: hypothetical protein JWO98_2075 [Frankiales bacterium]|nr:hypothetical protein [Frankiales bacterium]
MGLHASFGLGPVRVGGGVSNRTLGKGVALIWLLPWWLLKHSARATGWGPRGLWIAIVYTGKGIVWLGKGIVRLVRLALAAWARHRAGA